MTSATSTTSRSSEPLATYNLSISSSTITEKGGCQAVAQWLASQGVAADVTSNWSSIYGGHNEIEEGCRIVMAADHEKIQKLWPQLKTNFGLRCAHVKRESFFSGCIYDYLKESECPGRTDDDNKKC